jgi:hypothetical protein
VITKSLFLIALSVFSSPSFSRSLTYSPDNAVSYARKWVTNDKDKYGVQIQLRNPTYPDLSANGVGVDCTNFVSQALFAGGLTNTSTDNKTSDTRWFFIDKKNDNYSTTWALANGLYNRMNNGYKDMVHWKTNSYESWYLLNGLGSLNYGDIVFADWSGTGLSVSHTMIVTGFHRMSNGTIEARLSYHSNDRKDITVTDFNALVKKSYQNAKFYRFGKENVCLIPKSDQIF